ncbi:MAG: hypothetical protein ACRC2T_08010, partial [Thermoguttaceae bacterium]
LHLNKEPQQLAEIAPQVPTDFAQVVHKMMQKKPENRYQSITELQESLKKILSKMEFDAQENSTDTFSTASWNSAKIRILPAGSSYETQSDSSSTKESILSKMDSLLDKSPTYLFVIGFALALVVGAAASYARIYAYDPVFAVTPFQDSVPKMNTIAEQWVLACELGTEESWLAVIDFDGDSQPTNIMHRSTWEWKAMQQLAICYMKNGNTDKAFEIFREFADDAPEYWPYYRAFGCAGLYWYFAKKNDPIMMGAALGEFYQIQQENYDDIINEIFIEAKKVRDKP